MIETFNYKLSSTAILLVKTVNDGVVIMPYLLFYGNYSFHSYKISRIKHLLLTMIVTKEH